MRADDDSRSRTVVHDDELAGFFRRMRAEDVLAAPPPPGAAALRLRPLWRRAFATLTAGAVAASVLVMAGLFVTERAPLDDPAGLYVDAIRGIALETDQFLVVSEAVTPGLLDLPQVLDPAQAGSQGEVLN